LTRDTTKGGKKMKMTDKQIKKRLHWLRNEILKERISYGGLLEILALAQHIDPNDTLLLEWTVKAEGTRL